MDKPNRTRGRANTRSTAPQLRQMNEQVSATPQRRQMAESLASGGGQNAPAPSENPWGRPNTAPVQSAWGRGGPAAQQSAAPPQGAWGQPRGGGGGGGPVAQQPAAAVPLQGAWGQRGSSNVQQRHAAPQNVTQTGAEGRANLRTVEDVSSKKSATSSAGGNAAGLSSVGGGGGVGGNGSNGRGGNGGPSELTRGAVRGRRVVTDILKTRPPSGATKKGSSGTAVALKTNYFKLIKRPAWNLFQYRVDFSPDIEIAGLRKRLLAEQKQHLKGYLFDGTVLYLCIKLPNETTEFMSKDREGNPIMTTVKFVGTVSMCTAASLQVLNLILRGAMDGLRLQLVGRNFFDAVAKIDLPNYNLQLWPGYITSIRQHEQDILLCAEITTKVMRTETIYNILNEVQSKERDYKTAFLNQVLGMTVLTDYNNKTYRIDDVDFNQSPSNEFETKNGPLSFIQYYQQRYNIRIRDPKQPLLISKVKAKDLRNQENTNDIICLIPELCRATGLTDTMRNNFRLMEGLSEYTRVGPGERVKKLLSFNDRLSRTPASVETLTNWNVKLDNNLVELPGRQMVPQKILFQKNEGVITNKEADWTREFRNRSLYYVIPLEKWYLIHTNHDGRATQEFIKQLIMAGRGMGFHISQPTPVAITDDRQHTYSRALNECLNNDPKFIFIVVPNNNSDRYSNIKKTCYVERPVANQVVIAKTITPKPGKPQSSVMSVATKVAIQMASKIGGVPWAVHIPIIGLLTIGFDVCHDGRDKRKSYGAMVAVLDKSNKYFSAVSAHTNGEELCNEFALNITKAMRAYRDEVGTLPKKIMIYRDGVGEGQTDYVFEHETKLIKEKLESIYKQAGFTEKDCSMAFIIVSKRINTRFFLRDQNPSPGTVVDDIVTLPERYDFFLVSQWCRVGTVSPTSYNVLYDNLGLTADHIQIMSFKLTHLYFNFSATLRVPAVCQYAHKLAFLVGQYIHQSPSNVLEKQLYFL